MAKTKKKEVKVTASWKDETEILLNIEEPDGNSEEISATVRGNSMIRFSYKYPGVKQKMSYEGKVEGNKLYLYPIVGVGVLATSPLIIK